MGIIKARAKFMCHAVTKYLGSTRNAETGKYEPQPNFSYSFGAVVGGSGSNENDSFFASTPVGELKMSAVRDDLFEVGKSYYLDFVEAE